MPGLSLSVLGLLVLFLQFVFPVQATVSSCTASVSPTSLSRNISADLIFTVNNAGSTTAVWVKITSPSSNFTLTGGNASGWSNTLSGSSMIFTSGSIAAGSSGNFPISVQTVDSEVAAASWTVEVSDDAGGAGATTCGGSTGVAISGDQVPPEVTTLSLSDISSSSVKVSWTTNETTTGEVQYGADNTYGSAQASSATGTSHSVEITGLSANTTYHYTVEATDAAGNSNNSGDNTFVTAKTGTTTTTTVTVTTTKTETKIVAPPKDTTPPIVSLGNDFKKVYFAAPVLAGTASDASSGILSVDYSLDGGRNWLPVDKIANPGNKTTRFEFKPPALLDGNFGPKTRPAIWESAALTL